MYRNICNNNIYNNAFPDNALKGEALISTNSSCSVVCVSSLFALCTYILPRDIQVDCLKTIT